jgi:hypothetical protein
LNVVIDDALELLQVYGPQLAIQLVWFVGMVLAVMRWRRHPMVSLLTLLALGLFTLASLLNLIVALWFHVLESEELVQAIADNLGVIHVVDTVLYVAGAILLLIALFGWRYPPPHVSLENDWQAPHPGDASETASREGRSR